jgi:hypothetical protein
MIQAPYPHANYTPANTREFGIIQYAIDGSPAEVEAGRISAYLQMERACRGTYTVQPVVASGYYRNPRWSWPRANTFWTSGASGSLGYERDRSTVQNANNYTVKTKTLHFYCNPPRNF